MYFERIIRIALAIAIAVQVHGQTTWRASVDSSGEQANGTSWEPPSISADGSVVAFYSAATNLAPGNANGWEFNVFVHEVATGATSCVSLDPSGFVGDGSSAYPSLSADGRFVAFSSTAKTLVPGDSNNVSDVFVHDRATGETTRVSVDSSGSQGDEASFEPSISADGRYVAFNSTATNLVNGDDNDSLDVFAHDRQTGTTVRASVDSSGVQGDDNSYDACISGDGGTVTFYSYATNLVPGDSNGFHDVFVHELATGLTERVSIGAGGAEPNEKSWAGNLSADGRLVTFTSFASNLIPDDTEGITDVFVKDRATGAVTRATVDSQGVAADGTSEDAFLAPDGRYVAYASWATNLVPGDTNAAVDIFVHDLATGETVRASVDSDEAQADDFSWGPRLSGDGRHVAFMSWATNLVDGDTNEEWDIFVQDRTRPAIGTNYCGPANLNSSGMSAVIEAHGSEVVAKNDVELLARFLPQNQFGYFLNTQTKGFVANPGDSQGNLCLGGQIGRYAKLVANSGPEGWIDLTLDLEETPTPSGPVAIQPGETWHFQAWFRDKNPAQTSNFTDGITITFQ